MDVRMVDLRFNIKAKHVPEGVREETDEESARRQESQPAQETKVSGTNVLESTDKVILWKLVEGLLDSGYALVDAFARDSTPSFLSPTLRRLNSQDRRVSVFFRFVNPDFLNLELRLSDVKNETSLLKALEELTQDIIWRAEVWENPYFENQVPVDGQTMFAVNIVGRQPLIDENGEQYGVWIRDGLGEKMEKIFAKAEFVLVFNDDENIELLPVPV